MDVKRGAAVSSSGQAKPQSTKPGFAYEPAGRLFVADGELGRTPVFEDGGLVDVGPFELHPAAAVLSYGVSCFEGLKAFRQPDGGVALFRPDRNAARLVNSADALGLPAPPAELFLRACDEVTRSCLDEVPASGQGSLYLRPILFGTEPASRRRRREVRAVPRIRIARGQLLRRSPGRPRPRSQAASPGGRPRPAGSSRQREVRGELRLDSQGPPRRA